MYEFWFENKNTHEEAFIFAATINGAYAQLKNPNEWEFCGKECMD